MIELLVVIWKLLVILLLCSIGYTLVFIWNIFDCPNLRVKEHWAKMIEQLMVGIFFMYVLFIFIFGIIKCLI